MNYKKFYEYFEDIYEDNLQIANWHLNGDLEPLNNFIDDAIGYAEESNRLSSIKDFFIGILYRLHELKYVR